MDDVVFVKVPSDLAALLVEDEFDTVELTGRRGPGELVEILQVVWSVGNEGLVATASAVALYLERHRVAAFARRLAFWADKNPPEPDASGRFTLTIVAGGGDEAASLSLDCPADEQGRPQVDVEALARVLDSLVPGRGPER
ncbi:hypothetical protein ACQEU3_39075 [Spirillospora sp. CA-253888]